MGGSLRDDNQAEQRMDRIVSFPRTTRRVRSVFERTT